MRTHGWALKWTSEELQEDREIVLAAIKYDKYPLAYISKKLQEDREIVLTAIKYDKYPLACISKKLQVDREIVLTVVQQNKYEKRYILAELYKDPIFLEQYIYLNNNNDNIIVIKARHLDHLTPAIFGRILLYLFDGLGI